MACSRSLSEFLSRYAKANWSSTSLYVSVSITTSTGYSGHCSIRILWASSNTNTSTLYKDWLQAHRIPEQP